VKFSSVIKDCSTGFQDFQTDRIQGGEFKERKLVEEHSLKKGSIK
jgi:hypothetical protein